MSTDFTVRATQTLDDAQGVAECIYDEYHNNYIKQEVYNAEAFLHALAAGRLYSLLMRAPDGEPAAHLGLTMDENTPGIWEIGMAVVKKKYRGLKLMDQLNDVLLSFCAAQGGCTAALRCSVTGHTATQHIAMKTGFTPIGFRFQYYPQTDGKAGRITEAFSMKKFGADTCFPNYAPPEQESLIREIFTELGIEYLAGKQREAKSRTSNITWEINPISRSARAICEAVGEDFTNELGRFLLEAQKADMQMLEFLINMSSSLTELAYGQLKDSGFFFTGVLPLCKNGNYLMMQKITGEPIDFAAVLTMEKFTQLLEKVRAGM